MDYQKVNESSNREILGVNTVADALPIPYMVMALFVLVTGLILFIKVNIFLGFFYMIAIPVLLGVIFGRSPAKQLQRLTKPTWYANQACPLEFDASGLPKTPVPKRMGNFAPIHAHFPLKTYGQVNSENQEVGYRLFQWGTNDAKAIFDMEITALDSTAPQAEIRSQLNRVNQALCNLGCEFKSFWDVQSSCAGPLNQIAQQIQQASDPLTIAQLNSEAERLVSLKQDRKLATSTIRYQIKCRIELSDAHTPAESPADVVMDWMERLTPKAFRDHQKTDKDVWERAISYAYSRVYKDAFEMITSSQGFGLTARPLTDQEMTDWDYGESHNCGLEVPQSLVLEDEGLGEMIINDPHNHPLHRLFEPVGKTRAVPLFKEDCAYLPIKQKWVGAIRFSDLRTIPEIDESIEKGFLQFFYYRLCTGNNPITDFRLVTELLPDDPFWSRYLLEQTFRNSTRREDKAHMKRDVDVVARERKQAADSALSLLNQGNGVIDVALCLFLYRDSETELKKDLERVKRRFASTTCEIIRHRFEYVYFAQMALSSAPLLTFPTSAYSGPRHFLYRTSTVKAITTIPQIQPRPMDQQGIMLIGMELCIAFYLDIVHENPNHTLVTGETGAGKTLLMIRAIQAYILANQSGVVFDFPPPDGQSSYEPMVDTYNKLGVSAVYQSVDKACINIMGTPDIAWIDDLPQPGEPGYYSQQPTRKSAQQYIIQNKLKILEAITGLTDQTGTEAELMSRALGMCFADFYKTYLDRYEIASKAPFGSDDAAQMPIYSEFVTFAYGWFQGYVQDNEVSDHVKNQLDALYLLLKGAITSAIGSSINGISSFDTNVDVLVLALTNVDSSRDSLVYGLSGFDLLLRKAMTKRKTLLMMDEGSELFEHPVFAKMFGSICNGGRKWGCNVVVGFTGLKSLVTSPAASKVIANLQNKFVSKITENSFQILTEEFGFRPENLARFKSDAYRCNKQLQESYFLWKRDDREILVKYCPDDVTVGVGANDKKETEARNRVMANHSDPVEGLVTFGNQLSEANAKGIDPTTIGVHQHAA